MFFFSPLNRLKTTQKTSALRRRKHMNSLLLVAVENHVVDFGVLCFRWGHFTKLDTRTTIILKRHKYVWTNTISSRRIDTKHENWSEVCVRIDGSDALCCCVELVPASPWSRNSDRELQQLWPHPHSCQNIGRKWKCVDLIFGTFWSTTVFC